MIIFQHGNFQIYGTYSLLTVCDWIHAFDNELFVLHVAVPACSGVRGNGADSPVLA